MDQASSKNDVVNAGFIQKVLNEKYGDGVKLESFEVRAGSEKGDNFVGDLLAVDVRVSGHSLKENEKSLYWMVKTQRGPEGQGEGFAQIMGLFDREEAFYTRFLRDLDKYVKKDALRTVPLIYSTNEKGKEALVFENLKPLGFRDPLNKKVGFDIEHIQQGLKWLARLHGASHILYSKYPGGYQAWSKENFYSEPAKFSVFKDMCAVMTKNYLKTLQALRNGSENDVYVEKFESEYLRVFKDTNQFEKIENEIHSSRSEFKVLCHGDPWFNNMMFKYDTNQKIVDTIFLDMQVVYSGNVGTDLASFLSTCVTYENLTKDLDNYLHYYYDCLKAFILELEPSMIERIPLSFDDLKKDFTKSSMIGFFGALNGFPVVLVEKENMIDLDLNKIDMNDKENTEKFVEELTSFSTDMIFKNKVIYERMIGVIRFLLDLNALDYLK